MSGDYYANTGSDEPARRWSLVPDALFDALDPECIWDLQQMAYPGWKLGRGGVNDWFERETIMSYETLWRQKGILDDVQDLKPPSLEEMDCDVYGKFEEIIHNIAMSELGEDMEAIIVCFEEALSKGETEAEDVHEFIIEYEEMLTEMYSSMGGAMECSIQDVLDYHKLCYLRFECKTVAIDGIKMNVFTEEYVDNAAQTLLIEMPYSNILSVDRMELSKSG